jgi:pimeloyl-ACP methyl ester carboxylesterase
MEKKTVAVGKRGILRRLLLRLAGLAALGLFFWILIVAAIAGFFVYAITHPYCPAALESRSGYQSVTIRTQDGLQLQGWYRPPENGSVILILAGIGVNRDEGIPLAELVVAHGYGALTLEDRSCRGGVATAGYKEAEDAVVATDFLLAQPGVDAVGIIGFSAGGAAAIRAAALDGRILAVVAEGQFSELEDILSRQKQPWYSVDRQIGFFMALFYRMWTGVSVGELRPVADIAAISPRAVFLIFGEKEMNDTDATDQLAAAGEPKQLWVVPGAGHGQYLQIAGAEYERRLIAFFDRYLLKK